MMFGSEAEGLSNELKSFATKNITIEMAGNVESLNLSVSVAVVMYKIRN
jgi:tRNA G18 (ribose-2'-O)-methylase SpoU